MRLLTGETNKDFYPTPSKIAGMMFAGIDFNRVKTILEPSAGKGDLIDCLKCTEYKKYDRNMDVDCIEKDENLRYILDGKKYKTVFDDFLLFNSGKKYDLILMNPPFSEGDKHLLKALQMQRNGGQICCLLNAETLRNPYTNERKVLNNLLRKHNAKIKYVQNGFKNAERKTDVEIAIVWVDIPKNYGTSNIYEGLKRAEAIKNEQQEVTDIVSADTIQGMIERYNMEVKICTEFIREYQSLKPYILESLSEKQYNDPIIELSICGSKSNDINDCLKALRNKYWHEFMTKEELTSRFTETLRSKYRDIEHDMKNYDFNEFNIKKVIAHMNADIVGGLQEEIFKVFDKLSLEYSWYPESSKNVHYFNGWKTNQAHKVGMKAIIPANGAFSSYSWEKDELQVYKAYNSIADIEKVFNYLDGNLTADVNTSYMIQIAGRNGITRNIQCKYFSVTFYKKGTVHIKMYPETERIIDALNIYVCKGKNWLPPHYGKMSYDDMSTEEQAIVDDFQGKEKYEKIMQNSSLYLYEEQNMGNILMIE